MELMVLSIIAVLILGAVAYFRNFFRKWNQRYDDPKSPAYIPRSSRVPATRMSPNQSSHRIENNGFAGLGTHHSHQPWNPVNQLLTDQDDDLKRSHKDGNALSNTALFQGGESGGAGGGGSYEQPSSHDYGDSHLGDSSGHDSGSSDGGSSD